MSPHMPTSGEAVEAASNGIDVASRYGTELDAVQAAIDENPGRILRVRSDVTWLFDGDLNITDRSTRLVGEFGQREATGGTEFGFSSGGIVIGADDGQPWDANLYNGPQDTAIEHIWIRAVGTDTPLTLDATKLYKAGAYGLRDWRGGGLRLYNVGFEGFEFNFWGVNSDINDFFDVTSCYSKEGIYLGPRSDQNTIALLYAFYCDRVLTVDRAHGCALVDPRIVECGHGSSSPVDIRRGTSNFRCARPWLESLAFGGTSKDGFFALGLTDGYAATATPIDGVTIADATVYTVASGAGHVRSLVDLGAAVNVNIHDPAGHSSAVLQNLDTIILAPSGTSFTSSQAIAMVTGISSGLADADVFQNDGGGAPSIDAIMNGPAGRVLKTFVGSSLVNFAPQRSIFHAAAIPVAGTFRQGDIVIYTGAGVGLAIGAVCVVAGSPGTWREFGEIAGTPTNFLKNGDYTVLTTDHFLILRNASAPATWTLPATPADGQVIRFANHDAVDNLTLARNGRNINDAGANRTLTPGQRTTMVYVTSTLSWYEIG